MDMKIKRGQILRQLRLERQLTQNEAAENFGISQQTYQKYESGKTEATYDLLCDFAKFYGVTTDYLLGLEPQPPKDTLEILGIDKKVDDDEFMRLYSQLPYEAKQIFVDTMAKLSRAASSEKTKQSTETSIAQKPSIQASGKAIARSKNKEYLDIPTPEQMASFTPVPEDSDL